MHKREIKEAFSQLHASEELVREVMALKSEKKTVSRTWRIVARAAVCAAVVVAIVLTVALWPRGEGPGNQLDTPSTGTTAAPTMPTTPIAPTQTQGYELVMMSNVLKLYGCDKKDATEEELKQYEMTDGIDSYWEVAALFGSFSKGISFMFRFPDDYYAGAKITFEVSADFGRFLTDDRDKGSQECVNVENGDIIWWKYGSIDGMEEKVDDNGRFYANVIIYADEVIVGYGVIDFCSGVDNFDIPISWTTGFTTICYPLVDGEYQDVTEEYIWEQIEEYKRKKAELKGV